MPSSTVSENRGIGRRKTKPSPRPEKNEVKEKKVGGKYQTLGLGGLPDRKREMRPTF